MTLIEKLATQLNRIFGTEVLTADMSEAEALNALEDVESVAEIKSNSEALKDIQTRLSVLEKIDVTSFATQSALDEVKNNLQASIDKAIETSNSSLEDLKKETAKEIAFVKTQSSGSSSTKPDNIEGIKNKSEQGESEMKVNLNDLFKGQTVPGLI